VTNIFVHIQSSYKPQISGKGRKLFLIFPSPIHPQFLI